jgi:acyl dehydratase
MNQQWDDLTVGSGPEPREFGPISRTDIVRYQGASGDFNPIHHDEEYARAAGFPTVFSAGMLQAGMLATFATDWLGAANMRRYAVQFREQLWPGDVLICSATIARRYTANDDWHVDLDLVGTRAATGGVAVLAEATFIVPPADSR